MIKTRERKHGSGSCGGGGWAPAEEGGLGLEGLGRTGETQL